MSNTQGLAIASGYAANQTGASRIAPARTRDASSWSAVLAGAVYDAIDYGIAVLSSDGRLLFANAAARRELNRGEGVRIDETGRLRATDDDDDCQLLQARIAACARGLRRMLPLRGGRDSVLAVSSFADPDDTTQTCCLIIFSRRAPCERLSLDLFARMRGLTPAETQVFELLSSGSGPNEIAQQLGVRVSTIRTHIGKILGKNNIHSLRHLVQRVSTLPPVSGLLTAA